MFFQKLEDAARVLQRRVAARLSGRIRVIGPGFHVIGLEHFIPFAEHSFLKAVLVTDDERRIGIVPDILGMDKVVLQGVIDEPAQKGDVRAGPDLGIDVCFGCGPGKAGIDGDELRSVLQCRLDPFKGYGVVLGRVAADGHDTVAVFQVVPVVRHCTAPERGRKTCDRGRVSKTRLMFEGDNPR